MRETAEQATCQMWPDWPKRRVCGKPAAWAFASAVHGQIPMCEDCRVSTGTRREALISLTAEETADVR